MITVDGTTNLHCLFSSRRFLRWHCCSLSVDVRKTVPGYWWCAELAPRLPIPGPCLIPETLQTTRSIACCRWSRIRLPSTTALGLISSWTSNANSPMLSPLVSKRDAERRETGKNAREDKQGQQKNAVKDETEGTETRQDQLQEASWGRLFFFEDKTKQVR